MSPSDTFTVLFISCNIPADGGCEHNAPELVASTDNFSTLIGKGGFGSIYKGELNHITAAVKVLDKV